MSERNIGQPEPIPANLLPGKDEMNFAELPIAMLTDRECKGQRSIKFEDQVYDKRKRKLIPRKRVIEGSEEYGLPTATDDIVILALIQLTKLKNDFSNPLVDFTRREVIHMLGWADVGKSYLRLNKSLYRIKGVNYFYENAWWDTRLETWTSKAFSILNNVEINDSRSSVGQDGLFHSQIEWNSTVFESLRSGFVRDIDFQQCMKLEHPIALRLYRFLGKRFYQKPEWIFDLKEFADIYLNLGRRYEGGTQISRKLKPALTELENIGFLEPLSEKERFPKKGREWSIRLVKKLATDTAIAGELADTVQVDSENAASPQTQPNSPSLAQELILRGVAASVAAKLVKRHPERIGHQIEFFDWKMAQEPEEIDNPGGYLKRAIEDDYQAPPKFKTKHEIERQSEAKRQVDRKAAEERHQNQKQEAAEQSEHKHMIAYWESLTPEQQTDLQAAADALADPDELASQTGPFKSFGQTIRRQEYIKKLLRNRQTEEA